MSDASKKLRQQAEALNSRAHAIETLELADAAFNFAVKFREHVIAVQDHGVELNEDWQDAVLDFVHAMS